MPINIEPENTYQGMKLRFIHIQKHKHLHKYIYGYKYINKSVYTYVCIYIYVCMYVYVCVYMIYIYIYPHVVEPTYDPFQQTPIYIYICVGIYGHLKSSPEPLIAGQILKETTSWLFNHEPKTVNSRQHAHKHHSA